MVQRFFHFLKSKRARIKKANGVVSFCVQALVFEWTAVVEFEDFPPGRLCVFPPAAGSVAVVAVVVGVW